MKNTTRLAIAASGLMVLATGGRLFAAVGSDELVISPPTGGPALFDTPIPESTGPGTEPSALFAPGAGLPALVPPGGLAGLIPAGGVPGLSFVVLTEPAGEPVDPSELPPVTYSGPNGPVIVSDVLINGLNNQAGLPPFIALVSDNNPDLALVVHLIPTSTPVLVETGALQDLTPLIGSSVLPGVGPVEVQVVSDVSTPEPSTVALLGLAGMGLVWRRRRTA